MTEQHVTSAPFKPIILDLLRQAQLDQQAFLQGLSTAEREAIGTPEYWSAKDHIAHMTFWRQRLALQFAAILRHEAPPDSVDFVQINPQIFEEQRERPWSEVLLATEQTDAELITLLQQLSEADLVDAGRFDWMHDGDPLYTSIMGSSYEHARDHFAQYYLDRHDPTRATEIAERWTSRVVQTEAPEGMKGIALYNLACFYALHDQLEKAATTLAQAFTLAPNLKEFSLTDPDLTALRD